MVLEHSTINLSLTLQDDTLDKVIYLVKQVIAIIIFISLVYQALRPVGWFIVDLIQAIGFAVKVASIVMASVRFAL